MKTAVELGVAWAHGDDHGEWDIWTVEIETMGRLEGDQILRVAENKFWHEYTSADNTEKRDVAGFFLCAHEYIEEE